MNLNYQMIKILENCFRNISCFQFWSISNIDATTTHLYTFPASLAIIVEFLLDQLKPLFNAIIIMLFISFSIFSTSFDCTPNYWIYQTICQAMLIQFSVKPYTNDNTLLVTHATYQKAEFLWGTSLSKLYNTVNNNSTFNTKCPEFSTKCYVLFRFHNHTCAYNHPYSLHQKSVTSLQLFFTYLFGTYILIKSSLQSPLTLPFSIPQQFFTSLFFTYSHPYNIHQEYFPYLSHLAKSSSAKGPMSKGVLCEVKMFQPTLFWFLTSFSKYR